MTTTNPRYIMIGGFLGAGKTTAVMQLAKRLSDQGKKTGLIANDQSIGLVDSALMKTTGLPVEEIAGGCFCCKFNSLIEATQRLSTDSIPEFFVAEPVGSCTDLVATVSYPLRRLYGDNYTVAPLSVLVDPVRARRVMGLDETKSFSDKVIYIYKKQLEEADYIVINKQELLDEAQKAKLKEALLSEFSPRDVLFCSARSGEGLDEWFERLFNEEIGNKQPMTLDYDVYADGEALLGWLNAAVSVESETEFNGNQFIDTIAKLVHAKLVEQNIEIAHLKMTLTPSEGLGDIASVNVVRNDFTPELAERLAEPVKKGQLIINLRAEATSDSLKQAVESSLEHQPFEAVRVALEHLEHFQPAKPNPTHRYAIA